MKRLIFILLLTLVALASSSGRRSRATTSPVAMCCQATRASTSARFDRQGAKLGLDLQGGTQLTLQADMSQVPADQQRHAPCKGVVNVIERRVNAYGVAEPRSRRAAPTASSSSCQASRTSKKPRSSSARRPSSNSKSRTRTGQLVPVHRPAQRPDGAAHRRVSGARPSAGHLHRPRRPASGRLSSSTATARQLFGQITQRLVGKPLGIFLDGQQSLRADGPGGAHRRTASSPACRSTRRACSHCS